MKAKLSKAFNDQLATFFENHPPLPFGIFLRKMVLEYIRERIGIVFDLNFQRHLWSLEDLFELLDSASEEIEKQEKARQSHTALDTHIDTKK